MYAKSQKGDSAKLKHNREKNVIFFISREKYIFPKNLKFHRYRVLQKKKKTSRRLSRCFDRCNVLAAFAAVRGASASKRSRRWP